MSDPERPTLQKIAKLNQVLRELHAKCDAITEEIATLTSGGAGIGEKLKRLEHHFDTVWCQRYAPGASGAYVFSYAKEVPHLKRLLKTLPLEEIEARMTRYLASTESFYTHRKHPLALFVASVNTFAALDAKGGIEEAF